MNSAAFEDWKNLANAIPLLEVARKYGAVLKRNGQEWSGPCPNCGGKDRFSINPIKNKWNCRSAEGGSTSIGLAMHVARMSFTEACEDLTGEPPPNGKSKPLSDAEKQARDKQRADSQAAQRQREAQQDQYEDNTRESALAIWNASRPIAGTLAEKYLHGFDLIAPATGWPMSLRFHLALPYPGKGKMPALVARVDDLECELTGIWREFISPDGRKADVENQKLGLGPVSGGAVRLGGVGKKIGVAEGVRTALGAWALIGFAYPVWSVLSTSGMIGVELPLGVERCVIYPDGDRPISKRDGEYVPSVPAGRKAALALKARFDAEGIRCALASEPPSGLDYLDVWRSQRQEVA